MAINAETSLFIEHKVHRSIIYQHHHLYQYHAHQFLEHQHHFARSQLRSSTHLHSPSHEQQPAKQQVQYIQEPLMKLQRSHLNSHNTVDKNTSELTEVNAHHQDYKRPSCPVKLIRKTSHLSPILPVQKQQQFARTRSHSHIFSITPTQRAQIQYLLIAAFAYIVSPIDLLSEAVFGVFGILDDLIFLFMCLFCVAIVLLQPTVRKIKRTIMDKLCLRKRRPALANKHS